MFVQDQRATAFVAGAPGPRRTVPARRTEHHATFQADRASDVIRTADRAGGFVEGEVVEGQTTFDDRHQRLGLDHHAVLCGLQSGTQLAGAICAVAISLDGFADLAMVITRALPEMTRSGEAPEATPRRSPGPAGAGDLLGTCTSPANRNRRVGEELGRGNTIEEVLAGMNQVAEGVKAVSVVMDMATRMGINMPIAAEVPRRGEQGPDRAGHLPGPAVKYLGHEVHGAG